MSFAGKTKCTIASLPLSVSLFLSLSLWCFVVVFNVSADVLNEYLHHPNCTELDPTGSNVLWSSIDHLSQIYFISAWWMMIYYIYHIYWSSDNIVRWMITLHTKCEIFMHTLTFSVHQLCLFIKWILHHRQISCYWISGWRNQCDISVWNGHM